MKYYCLEPTVRAIPGTTPSRTGRFIIGSNPPTTAEGLWVIKQWAPWLDPMHPNPARPGELRWFTTGPDGEDIEVDGRGPHLINGESVGARSRTYPNFPNWRSDFAILSKKRESDQGAMKRKRL